MPSDSCGITVFEETVLIPISLLQSLTVLRSLQESCLFLVIARDPRTAMELLMIMDSPQNVKSYIYTFTKGEKTSLCSKRLIFSLES